MKKDFFVYNTLGKKKEKFVSLSTKEVKMYSCGPTVYSAPHIGNMRAYVFADILKRVLMHIGYNVNHVINITDVGHLVSDEDEGEDKMEKASRSNGKSAYEIADYFAKVFIKDMDNLSNLHPTKYTFATKYIKEQIDFIQVLEEKGYTYIIGDGVYFDVSKYGDYTKLAGLDLEGSSRVSRVGINKEKRNKADFALWKFSNKEEKRQMEWDSPWGVGFPGWHIECSAMAKANLGDEIDIHTGGIDHIPVHHTNERAQSECAHGKKFVNYWMHVNFLNTKKKMSKSLGNIITVEDVFMSGYEYNVLRFYYLMSHYRSEMVFSYESLRKAKSRYNKLVEKAKSVGAYQSKDFIDSIYVERVERELLDDLNTPKALSVFGEIIFDENISVDDRANLFNFIKNILGLEFVKFYNKEIPLYVKDLVIKRIEEKNKKNYSEADEIRNELSNKGFSLKDDKEGVLISADNYKDFYIKK